MKSVVLKSQAKYVAKNLAVLLPIVILTCLPAHADLVGGLNDAKTKADSAIKAIYGLIGVLAIGYLLFKFVEAWTGRADWKELGMAVIYVAAAGSVVVLAPWAWNYFVN